jgi:hypothetical protein
MTGASLTGLTVKTKDFLFESNPSVTVTSIVVEPF